MRSRYAAFALGLGEYLVDTLSNDQDDRAGPRAALARELSRVKKPQRLMGLENTASQMNGDRSEVTFRAKIFEKGKDRSFTEHSQFVREDGEWRYAFGEPKEE